MLASLRGLAGRGSLLWGVAGVRAGAAACVVVTPPRPPCRTVARMGRRGLEVLPPIDIKAIPRVGLDSLAPVPGSVRDKIRVGRGRSSGKGKTSGRGHKGQGQRGQSPIWFQGGQTRLWQKWPKRGRPNNESVKYAPLNVGTLMDAIAEGKLDPAFPIDARHLWRAGVVTGSVKSLTKDRWGIKLLSTGAEKLNCPITIEVQRASQKAIEAVERAGGVITCKYYAPINLRALLMPQKFAQIPRIPLPPPKKQGWYLRPENRGVITEAESVDKQA